MPERIANRIVNSIPPLDFAPNQETHAWSHPVWDRRKAPNTAAASTPFTRQLEIHPEHWASMLSDVQFRPNRRTTVAGI